MACLPIRYWTRRKRTLLLLGVLLLVLGGSWLMFQWASATLLSFAPVAAVLVALFSLIVTATGITANWTRGKRQSTIEAWVIWSQGSLPERKVITKYFGTQALSDEQGQALVELKELPEIANQDRDRVAECIRNVLNGLERIAVGVEFGVYDLPTLRALGGTTIVRTFERSEAYIKYRRAASDETVRHVKAFVSVEDLVRRLESTSLLERKNNLDKARLEALRGR